MKYKTVSDTVSSYPEPFNAYGLELCFKYSDIINVSKVNQKYPNGKLDPSSTNYHRLIQDIVTGRDIIEFTPSTDQLINSCTVRKRPKFLAPLDQKQCSEHFSIEKYFIGSFVCFDLAEKDVTWIPYYITTMTHAQPRLVHEVTLGDEFSNSTLIRTVIHSLESLPHFSRTFGSIIERVQMASSTFNRLDQLTKTVYMLTSSVHIFHELPRPYGKYFCVADSGKDIVSACVSACVNNRTIQMLNKTNYLYHIIPKLNPEYLDYRIISNADVQNESVSNMLDRYENICRNMCVEHVCTYDETITTLNTGFRKQSHLSDPNSIVISSLTSNHPVITNTKVAKVSLTDLIVYITSVLGTWFGLVIIKVTPESIWRFIRKRESTVAPDDDRILRTPPVIRVSKIDKKENIVYLD